MSAREGAFHAMKTWTHIAWKRDLGAYEIFEAECTRYPNPNWPELPFQELLRSPSAIASSLPYRVIDTLRAM